MYEDYSQEYESFYEGDMDLESYDLDEDYGRDTQDYQDLAYRHYAW